MSDKPKRHWYQFSLKSLMALMAAAGVGLGMVANYRYCVRRAEAHDKELKWWESTSRIATYSLDAHSEKIRGHVERQRQLRDEFLRAAWLPWLRPVDVVTPEDRQTQAIDKLNCLGIERVSRTNVDIGYGGRRGAIEPTHFGDDDLLILRDLPDLAELSINRGQVTDRGMTTIAQFPKLSSLSLLNIPITDAGVLQIAKLSRLKRLKLIGGKVSDNGVAELAKLSDLEELCLDGAEVTDVGSNSLKGLTRLQFLSLSGTKLTDRGLENLQNLTELTRLRLYGTEITDAGLAHLKRMSKLKTLSIGNTRVTSDGLAFLQPLSALGCLEMEGIELTEAGAEHLNRLSNLHQLNLVWFPGSGTVSPTTLASLAKLQSLTSIDMSNSGGYTPAQFEKLRQALPRTTIMEGYIHD